MRRRMFLGKIHRATVTDANLHYEGSVSIVEALMQACGMLPYEEVHIWNITRGTRLVTYAIPAAANSGTICINGAGAHLNQTGDMVILACFGEMEYVQASQHRPTVVLVDAHNRITTPPS